VFNGIKFHRHSVLILGLFLTWATFGIYIQVMNHEFVTYDDYEYVVQNPDVRSGITAKNVLRAFTLVHASNWHPLTWLSHMMDSELFGMNPSGHHMSSLILHIACVLLLFLFLLRTSKALWRSLLVAALFALHPLHVESVAWVSERKDVLSAVLWMLTLLAYRKYAMNPCLQTYVLTLVLFSLGLMAKPMLVTLPFVLLLLDYWPLGRLESKHPRAFLVLEKIPFFLLSAVCSVLTFMVQQRWGAIIEHIPMKWRLVNAFHSYTMYLLKVFWPHPLAFHYPHPLDSIPLSLTFGSLLLIGSITYLAVRFHRRLPYLTVGWLWYIGTLVPVIGLVQVGSHGMADRYTYIPMIGPFIILSWGAAHVAMRWSRFQRPVIAFFACATVALSVCSRQQAGTWKDSVSLYEHAIRVTEGNILAHNNLGNALAKQGRLVEAEQQLREAIRLRSDYAPAHNNLGNILARHGRIEESISHYEEALRLDPSFSHARYNLDLAIQKRMAVENQGDPSNAVLR